MELSLKNVTSYDKNKYTKISLEKRINILYGQNGAGKSTISNFFYNPADDDYRDCRCTNINNYRPLVYNTKFIEDNFFDKDVQKGIFTLSKENTEIEKEISKKREIVKELKIKLEATKANCRKFKDRNNEAETSCTESIWLNTEHIRNSDINSLMTGYLKNKRNLFTKVKSSIRLSDIDLNQLLTDYRELLNHKNTTIQTISPYNPYIISFDEEQLLKTPVIDSSNSYLSETIKKLQNLDWVKKGKEDYLVDDTCPFCQKETIDDKFKEALEQIFDKSYAQRITSIEKLKHIYESTTQEQLQLLKTQLTDCTAITIEERKTSLAHISSLEKMLKSNIELINNKIQNPSLSVTLDKDNDIEESLLKDIKQYNVRINTLNEKVKQFNLTQSKIQNQFWGALRNYCNTELEVLEKVQAENNITIKNLEECIDSINNEINHTDDEIKQLRNKTSNIDTTISSINSKLKNLGITCFYIDKHPTIKNSFVIVRSDNTLSKNVYRSLSEGEKTLITFLYFIEYCKGQTVGVIFVWMMTCVYQIDTVPTWHNGYTTLAFFLTVLLSGPILAAAILRAARVTFNTTPFAIISVLALIACAGVIVLQGLSLASIHSSVQQASALVPDYASLQVWRVVLLCAGLGCWLCPLIRRREPHVAGLILGLILILGGEMIGRVLFYGLHMTVGMAIAG